MSVTWKWFGNAGHFICGSDCSFHLCTKVGGYLVSTVGQYWPDRRVREIHASVHDPAWLDANKQRLGDDFDEAYMTRFGFEDIGYDRKFETMVFKAGKPCDASGCRCGMPRISGENLDFAAYNDAVQATKGHLRLCRKWEQKSRRPKK